MDCPKASPLFAVCPDSTVELLGSLNLQFHKDENKFDLKKREKTERAIANLYFGQQRFQNIRSEIETQEICSLYR